MKLNFTHKQDKVYFNVELGNNGGGVAVPATFNQTFQSPIIDVPDDYYCCVTKFSCPTTQIPIFIPTLQPASTTATIYSVTLTYNGNSSQQFVQYVAGSGFPNTAPTYYYVFNYNTFIDQINTALATAFAAITPPMGSQAPYFQYNPVTGLISFVAQRAYYDQTLSTPILIYINLPLSDLLTGFEGTYAPLGFVPTVTGQDDTISVYDQKNNWYNPSWVTPATPGDYYIMTQNYPSIGAWTPFKSLRLSSNSLPIKPEYIIPSFGTINLGSQGVLQTFVPLFDETGIHATSVNYVPGTNLHLLNMSGAKPIYQVDFQFQWIDGDGLAHPVYIDNNQVCAVEFGFFRKSTYTS